MKRRPRANVYLKVPLKLKKNSHELCYLLE